MRNHTRARTRVLTGLVASLLLAAGCADTSSNDSSDSSSGESGGMSLQEIYAGGIVGVEDNGDPGQPTEGSTLTVADYAEPRSLDPTVTIPDGAAGGSAMAAVYDVLVRYDPDQQEWVPQLAESLESNEDYTEWTLTLREGVTFSNGQPLDAQAVIDSINYYMENQGFGTLVLSQGLQNMEAVDERTVRFTLRSSWSSFPSQLARGPGMILAPAAIKGGADNFTPIGAGPFTQQSYKPGEELVLTRNPDYWGDTPPLEKLRFVWLGSDSARMDALEAGDVDMVNIRYSKEVVQAREAGWAGIMNPVGMPTLLWINNRQGSPGQDPRIRKAITMAIDPEVYLQRYANGVGWATRSMYIPTAPYYEEVDQTDYDPEQAKQLVQQAEADGADTSLTYVSQADQRSRSAAVALQAQLEAVGFDVKLDLLNSITEQISRVYVDHQYDLARAGVSIGTSSPFSALFANLQSESPSNPSGYASKEMDQLLADLRGADGEERQRLLTEINQLWQEENPGVSVQAGGFFQPWQEDVHGVVQGDYNLMLFHDAWKEQ